MTRAAAKEGGKEGGDGRDKDRLVNRSQSRQGLEYWVKQTDGII